MESGMQNHYFTPYPLANQYFCYDGTLTGMFPNGQTTEKASNVGPCQYYNGNWPWGLNFSNVMPVNALVGNGLQTNYNQYGSNFENPYYFNPFYMHWARYPYSSWFAGLSPYPQATAWQPFNTGFCTNQWIPSAAHNQTYYAWPSMNYFPNQSQFTSYAWPPTAYYGIQQTYSNKSEVQQGGDQNVRPERQETQHALQNTTSDVIRAFHVPSVVARKTVSDIPRSKNYSISIKKSETSTIKGESEDGLPFRVKISDSSIRQIAPSRSFGPSMVYNTESDPNGKPSPSLW